MASESDLGPGFPPTVLAAYPHMLEEDRVVWTRWLRMRGSRIDRVWYDVHVGLPVEVPNDLPPEIRAVSLAVTRKRIDCVARSGLEWWVIEVKPFGNFTALGQVIGYRRLFQEEYEVAGTVVGVVVCGKVDPDLVDDFADRGVRIEEVGYPT